MFQLPCTQAHTQESTLTIQRHPLPAQKAVNSAQSKVNAIQASLADIQQKAQIVAGQPSTVGGMWSPQLDTLMRNPVVKKAFSDAVINLKNSADADGTTFNPTEYAIKGADANGEPVISQVPTMKTIDAAISGLDNKIESYRDKTTKKLVLDDAGKTLVKLRSSLNDEARKLNPDWAAANDAYSGPAKSKEAMYMGQRFMSGDAEVTAKNIANLSDSDKSFFRIGAADKIRDMIDKTADTGDVTKKIFGNEDIRTKLRTAFPNQKSFDNFTNTIEAEKEFAKTHKAISKAYNNSQPDNVVDIRTPAQKFAQGVQKFGGTAIDLAQRNTAGKAAYIGSNVLNRAARNEGMSPADLSDMGSRLSTPNRLLGGKVPINESAIVRKPTFKQKFQNALSDVVDTTERIGATRNSNQ